ncbi:hypothetical protein AGMMS49921_00980 [Endomicrobiia bacterium]|nr:hypothetical protein AGMMS49921_00980 [Endomicrobiia bacterium]
MKLKQCLSIFIAFSFVLSSCDKKNAFLVNRSHVTTSETELSTNQQRGKDFIAKIIKCLQFDLTSNYDSTTSCCCYIGYNDKRTNNGYFMHKNKEIDGHFELLLGFDNQGYPTCSVSDDGSIGSNSSYDRADTVCHVLVVVDDARFVKEKKIPPITVKISYYNSSDFPLPAAADSQKKLTLSSARHIHSTDEAYTWW